MLVTCPECGEKISEKADSCPKCGLPNPGEVSKEKQELIIKNYGEIKTEIVFNIKFQCLHCGYVGNYWKKTLPKLIKRDIGYGHIPPCICCPRCGTDHSYSRKFIEEPRLINKNNGNKNEGLGCIIAFLFSVISLIIIGCIIYYRFR